MVNLLLSYNPNAIELLGLAPDNYLYLNDIGKMLFDNKRLFYQKNYSVIWRLCGCAT